MGLTSVSSPGSYGSYGYSGSYVASGSPPRAVWYKFYDASAYNNVTVSTAGSSFDTQLTVLAGSCTDTPLACTAGTDDTSAVDITSTV
ncbi:unnamed protein product, partial [Phaeothamnion confervicola]